MADARAPIGLASSFLAAVARHDRQRAALLWAAGQAAAAAAAQADLLNAADGRTDTQENLRRVVDLHAHLDALCELVGQGGNDQQRAARRAAYTKLADAYATLGLADRRRCAADGARRQR